MNEYKKGPISSMKKKSILPAKHLHVLFRLCTFAEKHVILNMGIQKCTKWALFIHPLTYAKHTTLNISHTEWQESQLFLFANPRLYMLLA
jgi:hypothetical protein